MALKILYENDTLLVLDKPAGIPVLKEGPFQGKTVADELIQQFPKQVQLGHEMRYGIVHRLDKETSGVLLVAKTPETYRFLQEQFRERKTEKKYVCLVVGNVKEDTGSIETLLARSPGDRRKQKAYPLLDQVPEGKRRASTEYRVLQRYQGYTLLEVSPKTGRKHQIRVHLASKEHPIAGDKLYGFKNQPTTPGLQRQFLHASFLKVSMLDGTTKEFHSELPQDLKETLQLLSPYENA